MNPVKRLKKELSVSISDRGIVQSINDGIMTIVLNGSVQKWPANESFQIGDNVVVQNGRLVKISVLKNSQTFEV